MLDLLDSIRVVLVGTSHPGNIGGAARAMKNMGLKHLCLVAPRAQFPHPEAVLRASGAEDLLEEAKVFDHLEEAVATATLVAGTSARSRHLPWPLVHPHQLADILHTELQVPQHAVALVFGREDRGLSNEELQRCDLHVHIPTNPNFSSLNLAAAVQVVSYEIYKRCLQESEAVQQKQGERTPPLANHQALEGFFSHLENTLVAIDFHDPKNPRQSMSRLRRLFLRARLDVQEVNMLRGILTLTQKAADQQKPLSPLQNIEQKRDF